MPRRKQTGAGPIGAILGPITGVANAIGLGAPPRRRQNGGSFKSVVNTGKNVAGSAVALVTPDLKRAADKLVKAGAAAALGAVASQGSGLKLGGQGRRKKRSTRAKTQRF